MKLLGWGLRTLGPRRIAVILAGLYALWLIFAYRYHFLDNVNLLIHEAGHVLFSPLGETLGLLGGTLLQLGFPLAFAVRFARRDERFEAALCGLWASESAMYTAEYMADANAQELPLVGGHTHDWAALLERAGWLGAAEELGLTLHLVASAGAAAAVWIAYRRSAPGG